VVVGLTSAPGVFHAIRIVHHTLTIAVCGEPAADAAMADITRLEARYSRFRDNSFLSDINRVAARGGSITVDEETAGLLDYAATCYAESGGLFDVTSGILRSAWRFAQGEQPGPGHIAALRAHIGWHRLSWPAAPRRLRC